MIVMDVGPYERKRDSQRKLSEFTSTLTSYEGCFTVTGIQGSSVVLSLLLTCLRWYESQQGVMHRLLADPVKDSESWNYSDMYRD